MKLSDITISNIKGSNNCGIIRGVSKIEAINLMLNLIEKSETFF